MKINFSVSKKQKAFIDAKEDQVLYGGAAGGGKTFAQIIDSFLKAILYPGIKQIIFRKSFPELNRSVILNALTLIPKELYSYSGQSHKMTFKNGSILEFGYIANDSDVSNYQSAEYDIIRFDENGIPMMYIFSSCKSFIRTFKSITYSKTDPEDLDTDSEDHIADEVRYMCMEHPLAPELAKAKVKVPYNPLD